MFRLASKSKKGDNIVHDSVPLLQSIRKDCKDYQWTESQCDQISQLVSSISHPDTKTQTLVRSDINCQLENNLVFRKQRYHGGE